MIDLNLTPAERRAYERALSSTHTMSVDIAILDSDEDEIGSIHVVDTALLEGQVRIDATADITRQLELTFVDPKGRLELDPRSPSDSALFADKFITVTRVDWVEELERNVRCPIFWGPISNYGRENEIVTVEALGKESLGLAPCVAWNPRTLRKGMNLVEAIEQLMRMQGERRFSLPQGINKKLNKNISVGRMDEPWKIAKRLANSIDRQLFYDGRGRLKMRRIPDDVLFTFYEEDPRKESITSSVITPPQFDFNLENVRNIIEVVGEDKGGKKKRVRAVARAPRKHPLSAESLGRNGEPRFLAERIENNNVKREEEAKKIADRTLRNKLRTELNVQFDALPQPHLEELDEVMLKSEDYNVRFNMKQFAIPVTAGQTMQVGTLKRRSFGRRLKKKRKRGKNAR